MAQATITWLGHATVMLTLPDGRVVFIDPWLGDNPSCPDSFKAPARCDLIAVTHGHFDHCGDAAKLAATHGAKLVGNYELCAVLARQAKGVLTAPMNTGGTQVVDGISVSLTRAYHSSSVDGPSGPIYAGMPNGVVIAADGLARLYHTGDTDVFGDMKLIADLHDPKVLCLPIGDLFTMGPRAAALAAGMFKPGLIVPIHHGTFPILTGTVAALRGALPADLRSTVVDVRPGQSVPWPSASP